MGVIRFSVALFLRVTAHRALPGVVLCGARTFLGVKAVRAETWLCPYFAPTLPLLYLYDAIARPTWTPIRL